MGVKERISGPLVDAVPPARQPRGVPERVRPLPMPGTEVPGGIAAVWTGLAGRRSTAATAPSSAGGTCGDQARAPAAVAFVASPNSARAWAGVAVTVANRPVRSMATRAPVERAHSRVLRRVCLVDPKRLSSLLGVAYWR